MKKEHAQCKNIDAEYKKIEEHVQCKQLMKNIPSAKNRKKCPVQKN